MSVSATVGRVEEYGLLANITPSIRWGLGDAGRH